jgi:hypothetical protein
VWSCIICGTKAAERPPRHCPKCGVSAGKFRLIVDRAPEPAPAPAVEEKPVEQPEEKPEAMAS